MKRFLTLDQMCDMLAVSRTRYYAMIKKGTEWHDPDVPKPRNVYGDHKKRFYSEDVENYIELVLSRSDAA